MIGDSFLGFLLLSIFPLTPHANDQTEPGQFGEVIEVRVINVDVIVTDRYGKPLRGLNRGDFELYEDGKRAEIDYFSRIEEGFLELDDVDSNAASAGQSADVPRTEPKVARDPVTWAIFIDQMSLAPKRRNEALEQLRLFLEQTVVDGRDQGIIALLDDAALRVRQNFTDDRQALLETLARIRKERFSISPSFRAASALRHELTTADTPATAEQGAATGLVVKSEWQFFAQTLGPRISQLIDEEVHRTRGAVLAMDGFLNVLERVEGRVILLYVGGGFNTTPGLELTELWRTLYAPVRNEPYAPRPERRQSALEEEMQRLFRRLSAMRVALYSVHSGDTGDIPDVEDPGTSVNLTLGSGDRGRMTAAGLTREMAERTGGLYFKVNPRLAAQLGAVRNDLMDYYSLGYTPKGTAGKPRTIKVRVNVEGARVRHRIDVRENTTQEAAVSSAIAKLIDPPRHVVAAPGHPRAPVVDEIDSANPLGISVEARRPLREQLGRDYLLPFDFKIRLESLTFIPAGEGYRADLLLHFALVGPEGTVWPIESREQTLRISKGELPATPGQEITYAWQLDLAPLRISPAIPVTEPGMRLSVSVIDRATQTRSIVAVPLPRRGR